MRIAEAKREERKRIFDVMNKRDLYIVTKEAHNPSQEDWQALKFPEGG